jgi:bifunctional DNA-binding transcriptional regulator/antitoxin component of YhaV-PrlF toxin-antitoxin module
MASQTAMQAAIEGKVTVSDKIRALAGAGASRSEIADFLGRSYQHVRQVLVNDERRRGASAAVKRGPAVPSGRESGREAQDRAGTSSSAPSSEPVFRITIDSDGRLAIPASVAEALELGPGRFAVGRIEDGEFVIAGATRSMRRAQEIVRALVPPGVSLADELIAERRKLND